MDLQRNAAAASGFDGVRYLTGRGQEKRPFQVRIKVGGKWTEFGTYAVAAEAALARARRLASMGTVESVCRVAGAL